MRWNGPVKASSARAMPRPTLRLRAQAPRTFMSRWRRRRCRRRPHWRSGLNSWHACRVKPQRGRMQMHDLLMSRLDAASREVKERRSVLADKGFRSMEEASAPRVATPWDLKRGRTFKGVNEFDVLVSGARPRVNEVVRAALVTHWGCDCKTFSLARERRIKGLRRGEGPQKLRGSSHPEGLPFVWSQPDDDLEKKKVIAGNAMANMAAEESLQALLDGRYFI